MNVVETIRRPPEVDREATKPAPSSTRYVAVEAGEIALTVNDREIPVVGIVNGGVVIAERLAGKIAKAALRFQFDGFAISRDVSVSGSGPTDDAEDGSPLTMVGVAMDEQLAKIIVSYLRQRGIGGGPLLRDLVGRAVDVKAISRKFARPDAMTRRSRILHGVLAAGAILVALAVFGFTAYQRMFVVEFYGFVTTPDVELVRASAPGIFYSSGASGNRLMASDELIGFVMAKGGKSYSVNSPCACYLGDATVKSGSAVTKGEVVGRVIRSDAAIEVTSRTPLSQLWAVNVGDSVELSSPAIPDPIEGRIVAIEPDKGASLATTNAAAQIPWIVRVHPAVAIDKSLVGSEIRIRVVRARGTLSNLFAR